MNGPCPSIISDLWKPNSKVWDEDKISTYFDDTFKNNVLNVPIINADIDDTIYWIHTPNATCTNKSAYKTFIQEIQDNTMNHGSLVTNQEIDILNQVWKSRTLAPRVKTFAWRLIRRAIASG